MYSYFIICLLLYTVRFCSSFDPASTTYAVVGGAFATGYASWSFAKCTFYECCDDTWIKLNLVGLENDLRSNLFGQHLVNRIILKSLKAHLSKTNPKKALVMSFNGWTGSGKNYVSQMIAQNLFKEQSKSQFIHIFIGSRDFPHQQKVDTYRDVLRKAVETATKKCERNLFVFDEVDKMPSGIMDALKPYLDFHEILNGVDYRKNIFIFLSNAGGQNITNVALKFWATGRDRESIALKNIEPLITQGAFNEVGGLRHSDIVRRDFIDVYVPFLPLEKKHVRQCVKAVLNADGKRNYGEQAVNKIADELVYVPEKTELFSVSGCKKVEHKVELYLD